MTTFDPATVERALVYGLAITNAAVARALVGRGIEVVLADDTVTDERRALAAELGVELVGAPDDDELARLVAAVDVVVPAPAVPETHPLIAAAAAGGVPVTSELEIAYEWEQRRSGGPRRLIAVTGTDGKTTTTLLTVAMLAAAGRRALAVGNTDTPLIAALDTDAEVFVVECSSFRLAWTAAFRADAAIWLNLAPDHQNWHRDLDSYAGAKARVFAQQRDGDVSIGSARDPIVAAALARSPARQVTFGLDAADYRVEGDALVGPDGPIAAVTAMRRSLPHDRTNALAAAAAVLELGLADASAVADALSGFVGPPHRIELVGESGGVRWYNDSKATTPHAAATAIGGFDHVVLIAGGRNKGLDLTPMAADPARVRAVVAIGEAADEIATIFGTSSRPCLRAASMAEAIGVAGAAALPGDAVLLSPGCASFDWYANYEARGDDFRRLVQLHLADDDPGRDRQAS